MRWLAALTLVLTGCNYTYAAVYPDGTPITWRCHPIVWQINPDGFTRDQINDFREAFQAAHTATNIQITYRGTTTDRPPQARNGIVTVYRTDLPGTTAATTWRYNNGGRYSGAIIQVDRGIPPYFFDDMAWHEVGHVLGLGHAPLPGQVMSTGGADPPYRAGDLAGLAAVGCPLDTGNTDALPSSTMRVAVFPSDNGGCG